MRSLTLDLEDGRTLSWAELGSEQPTEVLIANHGSPSSRLELAMHDELFSTLGIRVIAPERPGYGLSSPLQRARTVADWAGDVQQLVDAIGVEEFAVSGYSGGGPHGLAIAAAPGLRSRVTGVVLVASLAPGWEPGSAHDQEIVERAGLVPWDAFAEWYETDLAGEVGPLAPADDEAFADPAYLESAMATIEESARQGSIGDASDQWAFATPWGFDVADVSQHVDIWHGDADTVAAPTGAHVLHGMLPDSTVHSLPGDGHFSIGLRMADVLTGR